MVASSKRELKLTPSKDYTPPRLGDLINKAKTSIRTEYTRDNPSRLALISVLEIIHHHIEERMLTEKDLNIVDYKDVCLGAWVYCLENIEEEYRINNPTYKSGYLFDTGSTLYQILLTHLGITKHAQMTEKAKLYYLSRFYNYVFTDKKLDVDSMAAIKPKQVKQQLIDMMRRILATEKKDQDRILKALPSERSIDASMSRLDLDYIKKADPINPERVLLAQLAVVICKMNPPEKPSNKKDVVHLMPRSERIKIGMLIYIMEYINETYWFDESRWWSRKAKDHSDLYKLCNKALENNYKFLDNETRLACLTAFESFLNNDKNHAAMETTIKELVAEGRFTDAFYIDPVTRPLISNIGMMIKKIVPDERRIPVSNVTKTAAFTGAFAASIIGYGAGHASGYGVSIMDQLCKPKNGIRNITGYVMKVSMSMESCWYEYYFADLIINAITERMFAKIFEILWALCGAAGVGGVTFLIYDLSFSTAIELCQLCLHLNKEAGTKISEDDLLFITTMLSLPPEVFPEATKDKLRKIADAPFTKSGLGLLAPPTDPVKAEIPAEEPKKQNLPG